MFGFGGLFGFALRFVLVLFWKSLGLEFEVQFGLDLIFVLGFKFWFESRFEDLGLV